MERILNVGGLMSNVRTCSHRLGWLKWVFPSVWTVFLLSTGPCYDDDCSNPGEGWCEGDTVTRCEGAGMNQAYWIGSQDCAGEGLRCVEGLGQGHGGAETPLAWCLDVQECTKAMAFQCGQSPADGSPILMQCRDVSTTSWWGENGVKQLGGPAAVELVLEPVGSEGYGHPVENPLPCVECAGTCGCEAGSVCRDGLGVPADVVSAEGEAPVCCGRERGTDCPKGTACEMLDGTKGVCEKGARCDPCETALDCESQLLDCASTGGGLPPVCLTPAEAQQVFYDCRDDLGEAWRIDACGTWVEKAHNVAISFSCKEDTDQSWSLNACDQWIAMVEDCGDGFRCEANECIPRVPEIEVSPTLLAFGDTAVAGSKVLTLSIGNLGDGTLVVDEILVQPAAAAAQFKLSKTPLEVAESEIISIDVTFSPDKVGPFQGKILVRSNDKDEPEVTVLMNGSGV